MKESISLRIVRDAALLDRERAADVPQLIVPFESSVIDLEVAGASHRVDRSTFAVVPARTAHRMSARGSVVSVCVLGIGKAARDGAKREYSPDFSAEIFDAIVSAPRVLSRTRWVDEIVQRYVFERTVCEKHGSAAARFLETEITKELFFLGKEHLSKATRASVVREDDELASRARAWIDAHLFDSMSMKDLARACRSSESTLLRAFRRAFGVPPTMYARNKRLDEALLLIESGRYTVSEVAVRVGYGTVSAFTVAFGRRFGAAPSESRPRERPVLPPHAAPRDGNAKRIDGCSKARAPERGSIRSAMRTMLRMLLVACSACGAPAIDAPDAATPSPSSSSSSRTAQDPQHPRSLPTSRFGANVTASGVVFRVWAPHASAANVAGDFPEQSAAMAPEAGGVFSATIASAHAGTHYRFDLDGNKRLDPYCREVLADASACVVIDPSAYAWKTSAFKGAPRNATVVYEAHVGSFTQDGTFAAMRASLANVSQLGVNVLELMPVQSYGGKTNGWGYNPQLYFAPKAGLGSADDLRGLVDDAHAGGVGVWIDTVVNHMDGWSQAPLQCFDGDCPNGSHGIYFFPPGNYATTPWGPRPNYIEPRVKEMLLASVSSWLGEYRGDGFRWDSVSNIRALDGNGTTPGGRDLLVAANALAHQAGALSTAEDLKGYAAITQAPDAGGFGFDAQWDGFGYAITSVLQQTSDDARDLGAVQNALKGSYAGDPFARLLFVEDHDTVGNGGARIPNKIDPANPTSIFARRRSMLGGVLLLSAPGVPMIFMGEESLATGSFTNPPATLASTIPAIYGDKMRAFYTDMIALRRNLAGKSGGLLDTGVTILHRNDTNKVIAYERHGASGEDVVVVVNLRNKAYTRYDVGVPSSGTWRVRLDTDWTKYGDDFGGGATADVQTIAQIKDGQPYTLPVKLAAYGAVVVSR